ncbi:MAG: nickel insertion protein, partial [Planktothrix sp.]
MAKIAYFQCPTGISGDMCLGALVHAGVPLDYLKEKLQLLGISAEYELKSEPVRRQGQLATKVSVNLTQQNSDHHDHHHSTATRHLSQIEAIILQAKLPQQVEIWSLAIFRKLAQAEAAVHGIPVEEVHFHEVGA